MFKQIISSIKRNGAIDDSFIPLDIPPKGESNQKLFKFDRPDLISGFLGDIATISKTSQSRIAEEILLQQFMPNNRTYQQYAEELYRYSSVSKAVGRTIIGLLCKRTAWTEIKSSASYKDLVELIYSRVLGREIVYCHKNYKRGETNPMYHLMSNLASCEQHLNLGDNVFKNSFLYYLNEWNGGNPTGEFDYFHYSHIVHALNDNWERLDLFPGAYRVLMDVVKEAIEQRDDIFDIRDRIQLLSFIKYLDELETTDNTTKKLEMPSFICNGCGDNIKGAKYWISLHSDENSPSLVKLHLCHDCCKKVFKQMKGIVDNPYGTFDPSWPKHFDNTLAPVVENVQKEIYLEEVDI